MDYRMLLAPKRSYRTLPLIYGLVATILLTLAFKGRWPLQLFYMISWPASQFFEDSALVLQGIYGACQWAVIGWLLDEVPRWTITKRWSGPLRQFLSSHGLKILEWVLVLTFFISFALPADPKHELYGWMIFVAVPVFAPRDLLSEFGRLFEGDFHSIKDTIIVSLACIAWLSNFTAFFIRKKFIIYPILVVQAIFAVYVFLDPGLSPAYLFWAPSVIGLHLLRLVRGRPLVPRPGEPQND
jgi:hypothetical protein